MAMTFKQMRSCSIKGRKYFDDQRRQPGKLADMLLEYGNVLDMNSGADDMYKDELFEKYKFRHSEELCNWIYEEMREGDLVYPRNDVPDLSSVMGEINTTHVFSAKAFAQLSCRCEEEVGDGTVGQCGNSRI
jgi:hypothetical protein